MKFGCIFVSPRTRQNNQKAGTFLSSFGCVVDTSILPSAFLVLDIPASGSGCLDLGRLKEADGFFYTNTSNFISTMPRSNEVCARANNSTPITRRGSARTASRVSRNQDTEQSSEQLLIELAEAFEVEKNAKNEAYYFILSNGLLDQFADFCRNYHSRDPHKDCVEYLLSKC